MGNYNVGNETKNGSLCVCKWKGVVCLAGILISLVVGSFCVVTYGASAGEADGSESEQVDTSGNPTSDVEDGLTVQPEDMRSRRMEICRFIVCLTNAGRFSAGIRHTRLKII